MSIDNDVTPSSYDLTILVFKNIKRFLERTKTLVYGSVLGNFHTPQRLCNLSMTNNDSYSFSLSKSYRPFK